MNETMLFQQMEFYRYLTLSLLEATGEELADIIPPGFNNSIRWHLGHIYVSTENIVLRLAGEETQIPDGFKELFEGGTKPGEWRITPPTLTELKQYLTSQPDRIKVKLHGKLETLSASPFSIPGFVEFRTIGEIINFSLYHEGQHTGFIKALLKAVKS